MHTSVRPLLLTLLAAALAMAGCSRAASTPTTDAPAASPAAELRLGYFPNITHAPAIIGVAKGYFTSELGSTKLVTQTFNAGPDEVSALLGGSLDAAFIGSSPAINAFAKSNGQGVRLVAGSTSGGAQLVVAPSITAPDQLRGKIIATPQLGNTQDVSFKKWLRNNNLPQGTGAGAVTVQNLENARTLDLFRTGQIAGGWLPEPWSSRLVGAGAKVLVDERSLWPGGRFPTTVLIVRTPYLQQHPDTVTALVRGEQKAVDYATANPPDAKTITNTQIKQLTGSSLTPAVLDRAFAELSFTLDPLAAQFPQLSQDSVTAGVAKQATDLHGFVDVTQLDAAGLAATGQG